MPFQIPENVVIGLFVAALSLWGLIKEKWFLAETRKGQKLTRWFGPARAVWVLRVIFLVGILFGLLLAGGLIRPIQWG